LGTFRFRRPRNIWVANSDSRKPWTTGSASSPVR